MKTTSTLRAEFLPLYKLLKVRVFPSLSSTRWSCSALTASMLGSSSSVATSPSKSPVREPPSPSSGCCGVGVRRWLVLVCSTGSEEVSADRRGVEPVDGLAAGSGMSARAAWMGRAHGVGGHGLIGDKRGLTGAGCICGCGHRKSGFGRDRRVAGRRFLVKVWLCWARCQSRRAATKTVRCRFIQCLWWGSAPSVFNSPGSAQGHTSGRGAGSPPPTPH